MPKRERELTYPSNHLGLAGSSGSSSARALIRSRRPRAAAAHMSSGMAVVGVWGVGCGREGGQCEERGVWTFLLFWHAGSIWVSKVMTKNE